MGLIKKEELFLWVEECAKNNRLYQKKLVETYSPMLLYTAKRYVRDLPKSRDVLQDALLSIFQSIGSFEPSEVSSFEAWMRKITINTALKSLRKSWNKKEINGYEILPDKKVEPTVLHRMSADEILKLLDAIPEGYRTVFQMYIIDQMSHAEIAEALGISASTSRSQLARARVLLQKMYQNIDKKIMP